MEGTGLGTDRLRIVSWNIRAGGGRRVEEIAANIERWGAAVAALSEFRATPPSCRLRELLMGHGLVHQQTTADPRMPAANRLLVASRWPLRRVGLRDSPETGRWLMVRVAADRPFSLGTMHVPNRVSGQKYLFLAALLRLARRWRGGPALLIGDTNSGRIGLDEEVSVFGKREDAWMTSVEDAGWSDAFRHTHGEEPAYTWYSPNGRNGFRLDEAFVHRLLIPQLLDAGHEWAVPVGGAARRDAVSDHAALIVDLRQ